MIIHKFFPYKTPMLIWERFMPKFILFLSTLFLFASVAKSQTPPTDNFVEINFNQTDKLLRNITTNLPKATKYRHNRKMRHISNCRPKLHIKIILRIIIQHIKIIIAQTS